MFAVEAVSNCHRLSAGRKVPYFRRCFKVYYNSCGWTPRNNTASALAIRDPLEQSSKSCARGHFRASFYHEIPPKISRNAKKNIAIYRISRYIKNIAIYRISRYIAAALPPAHCEKFRTLISNSWPILQTSVTFPAHTSIGVKFIFEYHKLGKVAI